MCGPGRSNKDEFGIYTDCHVLFPVYYIFQSMTLLFSLFNMYTIGQVVWERRKINAKYIPDTHLILIFFQAVSMLILMVTRLSTGDTIIDQNLFLNLFQGIVRGFLWTVHAYDSLVYLHVNDITLKFVSGDRAKILGFLKGYQWFMYVSFFLFFAGEITMFSLVTYLPHQFGAWTMGLTGCTFGGLVTFGFQVMIISLRSNLHKIRHSNNDYKNVEEKLVAYRNLQCGAAVVNIPLVCLLFIPQVARHSYWIVNFFNLVTVVAARDLVIKRKVDELSLDASKRINSSTTERVQLVTVSHNHITPPSPGSPSGTSKHRGARTPASYNASEKGSVGRGSVVEPLELDKELEKEVIEKEDGVVEKEDGVVEKEDGVVEKEEGAEKDLSEKGEKEVLEKEKEMVDNEHYVV